MTQHPYADILRAIADGHSIQWANAAGEWHNQDARMVLDEVRDADFPPDRYRIKPRTIRIGEFDVPEPLRVAPAVGALYWAVQFANDAGTGEYEWADDEVDSALLGRGMCHPTREAAEQHSEALVALSLPR